MPKRILNGLIVFAGTGMAMLLTPPTLAANLLANGGFEKTGIPGGNLTERWQEQAIHYTPPLPVRWTYGYHNRNASLTLSEAPRSGQSALTVTNGDSPPFGLSMERIEVQPRTDYSFGVWVRGTGSGELAVWGQALEGRRKLGSVALKPADGWTECAGTLRVPGGTIRTVTFEIKVAGNSALTLDDAWFAVETDRNFDADTVLTRKPTRDEHTLLLVDFDGEGTYLAKGGASVTPANEGRFGQGLRVERKQGGHALIPLELKAMPQQGTLEFWIRPDPPPTHDDRIQLRFAELDAGSLAVLSVSVGTRGGRLNCNWPIKDVTYPKKHWIPCTRETAFDWFGNDSWHHVAVQWNAEAVRFYVDGVLADISTEQPLPFLKTPSTLTLGNQNPWFAWSGVIDEVRLSDIQRFGPIAAAGRDPVSLLAEKPSAAAAKKNDTAAPRQRPIPAFAELRREQIGTLPDPAPDAIAIDAAQARALIPAANKLLVAEDDPVAGMTTVRAGATMRCQAWETSGVYWKLPDDLEAGNYWIEIWYESGAGAPQGFWGATYVYLNGRIAQFTTTTDSVQLAPNRYFAGAQSAARERLEPGDEIAVTRGKVLRLVLSRTEPVRGRGWLPLRMGRNMHVGRNCLGLLLESEFVPADGKQTGYPQKWYNQVNELNTPDELKRNADGRALTRCVIGNPYPWPVTVRFRTDIKSYYRLRVGHEDATLTLAPHEGIERFVPFRVIPDSRRYTILATVEAIEPPDTGWPLDEIAFFPGYRQQIPFLKPFETREELALRFTGRLPGERQRLSLNGWWNSAFTLDLEPPVPAPDGLEWEHRNVPILRHQCRTVNMNPRPHGLYLKRTFTLPDAVKNRSYQLTIGKFIDEGTAYINGVKVGNMRGAESPLICDITAAVRPGTNEIVVVVRDMLAIMNPEYVNPEAPVMSRDYLDAPGAHSLWNGFAIGDVTVHAAPGVYAHDPLVQPSVQRKELAGFFTVSNNTDTERRVRAVARVLDAGEPVMDLRDESVALAAGASRDLHFKAPWTDPILWGPLNPHLYTLAVELTDPDTGERLDLLRARFGFRESWVEGPHMFFNGRTVRWKQPCISAGQRLRYDDCQLIRSPKYPDFMDEFGYPASKGLGGIGNQASRHNVNRDIFWETATANILGGVRLYGNHACIIAWDLSNEWLCFLDYGGGDPMKGARRFKTLANAVESLDPSRWTFFNGDEDLHGLHNTFSTHYMLEGTHRHPITGFGFKGHSVYFPDGAFFRDLDDDGFEPGEKVLVNSIRNVYYHYGSNALMNTENLWKVGHYMPPGPGKFVGEDDVLSPAIDAGRGPIAWMNKQNLDGHRDLGVVGLQNYNHRLGITRRGHAPQCFIMPDHTHHVFAGRRIERDYSLHNDLSLPAVLTLNWRFLSADGRIVAQGAEERDMPSGGMERGRLAFTAPDVDADSLYVLKMELLSNGEFVYGEERDIRVRPDRPPAIGTPGRRLFLFDPANTTAPTLTEAAIPFAATDLRDDAWRDPARAAIILGVEAVTGMDKSIANRLQSFVPNGGRVLVLRQSDCLPGLPVKTILEPKEWSSMPFVRVPQHPVLEGLTSWDLKFWNPGHVTSKGAYSKPQGGAATPLVDSGTDTGLEWVQMMECQRGTGSYLLNQLLVIEKYDTDPLARELLGRLIRYVADDAPFQPLTKPLLVLAGASQPVQNRLAEIEADLRVAPPTTPLHGGDVLLVDALTLPADFTAPDVWRDALDNGARVIVHNAGPEQSEMLTALAGRAVVLEAQPIDIWEGRAVRNGFTDLTAGLSQMDLYWKKYMDWQSHQDQAEEPQHKIEDVVFWSASADGAVEHVYPGGLVEIPVGDGALIIDQVRWHTDAAELGGRANRYVSALLKGLHIDLLPAAAPPSLPAAVTLQPIDLTPFLNRGFIDPVGGDGEGGWSDQGPKFDLREFPVNRKEFGGVPFTIGKEPRTCIVLKTKARPHPDKFPDEANIPLGYAVEGLYFLHSSAYTGPENGMYQIQYDDGQTFEIPLILGVNIRDWAGEPGPFPKEKITRSEVAWTGSCEGFSVISVYRMLWVNPRPEVPIKAVRFANPGKRGCPILIALTAALPGAGAGPQSAPEREHAVEWLQKGVGASRAGDDETARTALRKALELDPDLAAAYQELGEVCERLKDEEGLISCYEAWIAHGAQTPLPFNRLGKIAEARGDDKQALHYFEQSLKIEWNQPAIIDAKTRLLQKVGR